MVDETRRKTHEDETPRAASSDPEDDEGGANPFGVIPILVLLVLVVGGLFLIFRLRDMGNIQDCVSSGRKNCVPVDVPPEK